MFASAELPLAIFTTLAPIGAGGFVGLAALLFAGAIGEDKYKKADIVALVALILTCVGFLASTMHVANAGHIMGAVSGIGSSPMSNEVVCGIVFVVVAAIYVILAWTGKLAAGARKGFAAVVAVVGIVFMIMTAMAYMIATIATWNSVLTIAEILGIGITGAAAFAALTLAMTDEGSAAKSCVMALAVIGAALAVIGVIGIAVVASGTASYVVDGGAVVSGNMVAIVCSIICFVAAAALNIIGRSSTLAAAAVVLAVVAGLAARCAFYGMMISVGLAL